MVKTYFGKEFLFVCQKEEKKGLYEYYGCHHGMNC